MLTYTLVNQQTLPIGVYGEKLFVTRKRIIFITETKMKPKAITLEIFIALLVLFWVYAGITKLLDYDTYWRQVMHYIHSTMWAKGIAIALPVGQLLVAVGLVFQQSRKTALYVSLAILLLFTGYITYLLYFAAFTPCSCTGIIPGFSWHQHLLLNVVFLLINIAGIILMIKEPLLRRYQTI